MFYFILFLLSLALTAAALFFFIRSNELSSKLRRMAETWRQKEEAYTSELDKLEKIRHIPDIIERARRSNHILDELADEFGFSKSGEKLKLARERTKLMQTNGTAANCGYADGWKKDHALKFVLSTFNG